MLTRGGAGRIGGADPDRVPASTWRPALGSGGAGHGILTAGVRAGTPLGAQIHGVTGAIGTAAEAPQKRMQGGRRPQGNSGRLPGKD
jgi:hypothetical protein